MSAFTVVSDHGVLLDPAGYMPQSETASTSFGTLVAADSTGVKGTAQLFDGRSASQTVQVQMQVLCRVPWTLTTQCATATARATMRASLLIAGVVVATSDGAPRNINATNGTKYTELIAMSMAAPVTINPGDILELKIELLITTVGGAGTTVTATLRHDPQVILDQLVLNFQGAAGLV